MDDIKREDFMNDEMKADKPNGENDNSAPGIGEDIETENRETPAEEPVGEINENVSQEPEEEIRPVSEEVPEEKTADAWEERTEEIPEQKTEYTSGQRYTYNPSGTVDEPSFLRAGSAYTQPAQGTSYPYGQPMGDGSAQGTPYGQPMGDRSAQGPSYGQSTQGTPYSQPAAGTPGSSYGQSAGDRNVQGPSYSQPAAGTPGSSYGQPTGDRGAQGPSYGQPTGDSRIQGGPHGRPAQGNTYGQSSAGNTQRNSYGQPTHSHDQRTAPYGQADRNRQNGRFSNDGYGKGGTGYSSNYDSYRFETPVDPAPINSEDTRYKKKKPRNHEDKSGKNNSENNLRKAGLIAGMAAVFGLVAALVFLAVTSLAGRKVSEPKAESKSEITAIPTPEIAVGRPDTEAETESQPAAAAYDDAAEAPVLTVPQVVEQCMPSMVAITNTTIEEYQDFFGGRSQQESVSAGSGIIVGETETELLIATNNHVIQNSKDITVTFIDENVIPGTIKGMDADNDLAIVAVKLDDISQETRDAIRIITIGDSDAVVVGESVVAIGNALGYGQSVSAGIISALNREVTIDGQSHRLLQTDASINPGNSGGALINMRGELIGINEVKYVDETVEGVGYAIPMATAEPILDSLGSKTARQKVPDDQASYIGIKCIDVPSYYVQAGYPSGVYVSEVTEGGPAEAAGLKEGDIITAIDGIGVSSSSQLINYLQYYAAGEVIDFSVSRLNDDNTAFESSKIAITLGSKKEAGLLDDNEEPENSSDQGEDTSGEEAPAEEEAPEEEAPAEESNGFGEFPILPDVENR